jgi:LPXTG-motif cell wall-anchored protein
MRGLKLGAILLIVAGALGLAYGAFRYNTETHRASVGGLEISVSEHRTVNVPIWAGVGAIVVGAVLLLARKKREA